MGLATGLPRAGAEQSCEALFNACPQDNCDAEYGIVLWDEWVTPGWVGLLRPFR